MIGLLMGVLWFTGNTLYGIGATMLGKLGTAVGWPLFIVRRRPAI